VCHDAAIVHYDGDLWDRMEHDLTNEWLRGVWGSGADDVYAVGDNGTILHYDGSAWSKMNSRTLEHLYGVWGTSRENIYAVGAAGTILHYNGVIWSDILESAPPDDLHTIWGTSADDIYVAGGNGTILHYDGLDWLPMESHTDAWILSLWGTTDNIYAVGGYFDGVGKWLNPDSWNGGVILHYDGMLWSEIKTDIPDRLFSIWGSSGDDIYAVGAFATILHYSDTTGDGSCILTNLYGEHSEKVTLMRLFRDTKLTKTFIGRIAVKAYYSISPLMVNTVGENDGVKGVLKNLIDTILPWCIE